MNEPNPKLPWKLGIVGHAAEKFTQETERKAKSAMFFELKVNKPSVIVSGRSPMGGVDLWAEELAREFGIPTEIYAPTKHRWDGPGGFKERNLKIAEASDEVLVVVVDRFPPGFHGKRFEVCYHCRERNLPHIKSGACWTAWQAVKLGKRAKWLIVG